MFSNISYKFIFRNRFFFLLDIILLLIIPTVALGLRLDGFANLQPYQNGLIIYTLISTAISLVVFHRFQLYKRYWRYASIQESILIGFAVVTSTGLILALFFAWRFVFAQFPEIIPVVGPYFENFAELPRSLPFIVPLLMLYSIGGVRYSYRLIDRWRQPHKLKMSGSVIIMGAGDAGAMIARELQKNRHLNLEAIAFLDDDPDKWGVKIHGIPVMGDRTKIPGVALEYRVKQVIIAMPTASGKTIREIVNICETAQVETKIMPGIYELLDGTVNVSQLRDVEIEDLLRREPVKTDITAVKDFIQGRRVLVTGGGGSIGSELCRQVFNSSPAELVILDHSENSVFIIHNELKNLLQASRIRHNQPNGNGASVASYIPSEKTKIHPVVADIRFFDKMQQIFGKYQPDIVFHAAAHKHVPLMEANPAEAIINNIFGTQNVLRAAIAADVEHFVMISTDKAVNPTNIMGATKRVAELIVHRAAQESGRPYVAVRFGNVLGSSGSVVLTFKEQISSGGPVTVTHPEMRRFFMTIPEAVQLVLQAATLGTGDEVYVLDMGEPVKILDLAYDLIRLSGLEVGRDIDIEFTSPRPGEKFFEELFIAGEEYGRTRHKKIFTSKRSSNFVFKDFDLNLAMLESVTEKGDRSDIINCLKNLVPEFQHAALVGRMG